MLELRPNCEYCDRDLPPGSPDARICSYECTFCAHCVETVLHNVCPNCAGGLVARPIRPATAWRPNVSLTQHPASDKRRHLKFEREDIALFCQRMSGIPPENR